MKIFFLLPLVLLTGCVYVPVYPPFPKVPEELTTQCPDLHQLPEKTEALSQVLANVAKNYNEYHECRLRVETWNEWYIEQKRIWEIKK